MNNATEKVKKILLDEDYTCVIMNNEGEIIKSNENGIKPLMKLVLADETALNDAYAADKVIGRAAAAILIQGKIKECYGGLMSERAIELFDKHGIPYFFGRKVPVIQNRDKTGVCPMEKMTEGLDAPEAYEVLRSLKQFA